MMVKRKKEQDKYLGLPTKTSAEKYYDSITEFLPKPVKAFLSLIYTPVYERRMLIWYKQVIAAIKHLRQHHRELEEDVLKLNESFLTTALHAVQIAARTHQENKREALRNAVLNSALPNAPDEDVQLMFLNAIDVFGKWHIKLLDFMSAPFDRIKEVPRPIPGMKGEWVRVMLASWQAFPELGGRQTFVTQVIEDLKNRGFVESRHLLGTFVELERSYTTDLGERFLKFIKTPPELDNKEPD